MTLCNGGEVKSYGDSMILAARIFSQSAPGWFSIAYFRKLAHPAGVGDANFRKHAPYTLRFNSCDEIRMPVKRRRP